MPKLNRVSQFATATFSLLFAIVVNGQTAARPDRGIQTSGSYSISNIEKINLATGDVNLSIPLASLPPIAGNKLSLTLNATYNSKLWDVTRQRVFQAEPPVWDYIVDTPQLSQTGGWSVYGGYYLIFRDSHDDFNWVFTGSDSDFNYLSQHPNWHKRFVITPDGAEHEIRPLGYSPYSGARSYLWGYYEDFPSNQPLSYYTIDGTYLWVKIYPDNDPSGINAEIYSRDGTIVRFQSGLQRIIDTNGNEIRIWSDTNGTHYSDYQTGREIRVDSSSPGLTRIWYDTVGGTSMHTDISWGTTYVQGQTFPTQIPVQSGGDCENMTRLNGVTIDVIRSITFPQTEPGQPGRSFTFTYNSDTTESVDLWWWPTCEFAQQITTSSRGWGEIKQMVMPSGATVNYSYQLDTNHELSEANEAARDSITSKVITHDGVSDTWSYNTSSSVVNPDGSTITEYTYPQDVAFPSTWGGANGLGGLVYRTNQSNKILVEKQWQRKVFSGAVDNFTGLGLATFNPVVVGEYTSLLDDTPSHNPIKMSAKTFQYDYNGNVLEEKHYDWFDPSLVTRDSFGVPTAVPASALLLRTISHDYYNPASSSTSLNVYAKRSITMSTPLILSAEQQVTVGPSVVQFSYDGQAYGLAPTAGNLTSKKVWDDVDAKWITTSNAYGVYGNVATSTDARGKVTQFFYEDATHALPTRVVVDPQNGSGAQTTTTVYDFSTGFVTNQTDVNGQVTTIDYTNQLLGTTDPFGRPGITKAPPINIGGTDHRRRTTTTYFDATRQLIVETDLNAENDKLLKTRTTTDMLGRPILSETTEDGTNYSNSVRYAYLNMGQVTLASSPMHSAAESTDSWTRVTKDIAGRVTEVATFGGATQPAWTGTTGTFTGAVTTVYSANFTTVTDQAGKVRRSMVDALGRLARVDEPDASGNLGSTTSPVQPTNYEYDVFDNLKKVIQGSQERTFSYDSLSHLRTAINPESGTINYQYDDNGNLVVKTDARSVSSHYEYDSLNRVTRRWYNGSNSILHTTHNSPSLPSGVGTCDEVKFYYDSQLPVGAPAYDPGTAKGRLVAETYGSGTSGNYYAYDVLGRQILKLQRNGNRDYQLTNTLNLAGMPLAVGYPSGHAVNYSYDAGGRTSSVVGNLGDGSSRSYASNLSYSAVGALTRERFGTNTPLYHKTFYNSRGQLFDARLSSVDDMWDWNRGRLIFYYSSNHQWGQSGTDNNGNVRFAETWIPPESAALDQSDTLFEETYNYDELNRLTSVTGQSTSVTTGWGTWQQQFRQTYAYDRYGNRTINTDPAQTWGTGINNKVFEKETATNRLYAPGDLALPDEQRQIRYDGAGNQYKDTYTGYGTAAFDGNNHITTIQDKNGGSADYTYDADGQRTRRKIGNQETWQIYGIGGELLAEYPADGSPATPQKEYGYRNGQLLITATPGSGPGSLSLNGSTAYAEVPNSSSLNIAGSITMEAWVKTNGTSNVQQDILIRHDWGVSGSGGGYELSMTNLNKARMDLYQSPTTYTSLIGNTALSTGVWHHIAGVFDGSQMRLYVDGVLDATGTSTGPTSGTAGVRLGRNEQNGTYYFNGLIDEVRVSTGALYSSNFTPAASLAASSSTKGLWKFDGQSAADSSTNGNNATLNGNATYSTDVPTGPSTSYYSGAFNGSSAYAEVPNSSSLNIAGSITMEAWVKTNGTSNVQQDILIRHDWGVSGSGGGYELSMTNLNKARMDLYQSPTTYTSLIGNTALSTGVWHHIAGVFDGSQMRLYVDGVLDATGTSTGPTSGTAGVRLGRNEQNGMYYFNGLIDEVRVSTGALYSSNFTPQTHLTASGSTKGLWKFDSQSTADSSGNGNNGTLQSGATYSTDVPSGDGGGGGSSSGSTPRVQWLVADHLGTPRMIVDQTGTLANLKRHDYLPFGEELFAGAGGRSTPLGYTGGDGVRQQFALYERDTETDLDYAQARYYSSRQARFTSVDPLMSSAKPPMPQSWNRYSYCLNNPAAFVDPNGMLWYRKKNTETPVWFDSNPGSDYELWGDMVYWAGDQHKWVRLSYWTNDLTEGYETEADARAGFIFSEAWADFVDTAKKSWSWGNIKADTERFLSDPLGRGGFGDPAFIMLGAPGPLSGVGASVAGTQEETTTLYRAVMERELDDIAEFGAYRLPEGQAEVKGFFSSAEEAAGFAKKMFQRAPGEGPYTITSIDVSSRSLQGLQWQHIAGEGNAVFLRQMPAGPIKVFNFSPNPNFKF